MTISSLIHRNDYVGSGTTGPFAFAFRIFAATDLAVIRRNAAGTETTLTYFVDYTLSTAAVGNRAGGTVTLTTALAADGSTLTLLRSMSLLQPTELRNQGPFFPETIEDAFDRLVMIDQGQQDAIDRSLRLPKSYAPGAANEIVPTAGYAIVGTGTGFTSQKLDASATVALPGAGRTVSTLTTYLANNAVANVKDFGAKGDGVTDDTSRIQAAIDTGQSVFFPVPAVAYRCVGLTQSTIGQVLFAQGGGFVKLMKNGNGVILTSTGNNVQCQGITFSGDASTPTFTGHNVTFSGDNCALINCGSMWAAGRAVKATGGHFQIIHTCSIYQTADTSATGYDVEIGVSGTATLYHHLVGVYSSQSTGGILLTDVGEHLIEGGQFGKLSIMAGTSPAGAGGGKTIGARILGPIVVQLSGATLLENHRGASATVTFALGTSGCAFVEHSVSSGAAITNLGNANNVIIRNVSTGSVMQIQYGADGSKAVMEADSSGTGDGHFKFAALRVTNNSGNVTWENAAGGAGADAVTSVAGDWFLTNRTSGRGTTVTGTGAGSSFALTMNGATNFKVNDTGVGFNGATPVAKPTITGSRGAATAAVLALLLTALASEGLITDSTTA